MPVALVKLKDASLACTCRPSGPNTRVPMAPPRYLRRLILQEQNDGDEEEEEEDPITSPGTAYLVGQVKTWYGCSQRCTLQCFIMTV